MAGAAGRHGGWWWCMCPEATVEGRTVPPVLTSALYSLDPQRSRVWLEQICYVWRRRGRRAAESHSVWVIG